MRRSISQAVYKILPGIWISDKDKNGRNVTALVKSWNYKKMEGIYSEFIQTEIKRQIRLFEAKGGDVGSFNDITDGVDSFSIVEPACRENIPDIISELSPLLYYCSDCHKAVQFDKASQVKYICPSCGSDKLKQLQLVYACECGYAEAITMPKVKGVKDFYYLPDEKSYGMFYYNGNIRMFKEFGIKCPNCGQFIQRDSAESAANFRAFTATVINLINQDMGKFYEKGLDAYKIMVSKWLNKISQESFNKIVGNVDKAFSEENSKSAKLKEAEASARNLLALGVMPEEKLNETIIALANSNNKGELSIDDYISYCDNVFAREKNVSEEGYNLFISKIAFNLMQYETVKNAKNVISLEEAIEQQLNMGFIDDRDEIIDLNNKIGIKAVQASCDVEIISCSYGFTRKVTDPQNSHGKLRLNAFDKDSDNGKNLVYGMKLETEGILFDIDMCKIIRWLLENKIIGEEILPDLEDEVAVKKWFLQNVHGDRISPFGEIDDNDAITKNVFLLLHSMAHAFIKTAGELSGISANSLTEIIFVETCSIFIYSQSSQGQVLGSLSGMMESLYSKFLSQVFADNRECVFDPICADRDEFSCQGCLVLADTSCKYFNTKLGRNYLYTFNTEKNKIIGFWEM